uniref:Putative transport system ATP-binding protein n=1 Tax=uncultured bacterium 50 TaxID=1748278 RepID=A0A0U3JC06_9BACT|nr:putative transport system ATP-binding protein [uncultured bacterium 50]
MELLLDGLSAGYGDRTVVHGVSLRIAPGTIGCLLGPSGCGKTTVLRVIAGFEPVSTGRVTGDGLELTGSAGIVIPPERRGIGMVFQDLALMPHLSVAGNVAFGLHRQSRAERAARVAELLELVGLSASAQAFPHQLSGGQQQRVALARALAPRPRLVLLDEPFSSLDVELRERLSQDVRAILLHEKTTALLVTHSQFEAFAMADVIGVMNQGRLHQWDSAYNLYHRPVDRFVADFVGEGRLLPAMRRADGSVETTLGVLPARNGASGTTAGPVDVLLRPDDVVHDDASPVGAVVSARAFRGAEFLYTLRLDSGHELLSLVPSHHDHAVGTRIGIRLDVEHLIAFGI